MLGKIQLSIFRQSSSADKWQQVLPLDDVTRFSWESQKGNVAAYALQGRRSKMEDRFVINENIDDTGVSLIAVFDGHGGEVCIFFILVYKSPLELHKSTHTEPVGLLVIQQCHNGRREEISNKISGCVCIK
jgi:Serine/threonine protein phosphatase